MPLAAHCLCTQSSTVLQHQPCWCLITCIFMQAIIACHCQNAAPTLTTIFEIAALTAPLVRTSHDSLAENGSTSSSSSSTGAESPHADTPAQQPAGNSSHAHQHRLHGPEAVLRPPLGLTQALLLVGLRLARGWAPAVVLAQGVRLVGSIVQKREHPHEEPRQEGTEGTGGEGWCVCVCVCLHCTGHSKCIRKVQQCIRKVHTQHKQVGVTQLVLAHLQ